MEIHTLKLVSYPGDMGVRIVTLRVSIHVSVHKLIGCEIKFVKNGKWSHPFVDQRQHQHPLMHHVQHHVPHHVPHQHPTLPLKIWVLDFVVISQGIITKVIGKLAFIVLTYQPAKKNARTKTSVLVLHGPRTLQLMIMAAIPTPYHDVLCIIAR